MYLKTTIGQAFAVLICLMIALSFSMMQPQIKTVKVAPKLSSFFQEVKLFKSRMNNPLKTQLEAEASQYKKVRQVVVPSNDLTCMAENIYREAGIEGYTGKLAVGQVVLNRVKAKQWADTPCKVIWQGSMSATSSACQFSWTCTDGLPPINKNSFAWKQSVVAATELLTQRTFYDYTDGATHYHAHYVNPEWSRSSKLERTIKIDSHIFYKLAKA